MKKAGSKRELQAKATREKIFNAAIALLEEKGYDGFTIDDIQERTGCSRGLFYNYFRSINDIMSELIFSNQQEYKEIYNTCLVDTRGFDKIMLFAQYVAELHAEQEHKNSLRVHYMNLIRSGNDVKYTPVSERNLGFVIMLEGLKECQADGVLVKDIDLEQAAGDIMVLLRGNILEYLMNDSVPAADLSRNVARMTAAYLTGIHAGNERVSVPPIKRIRDINGVMFSSRHIFDRREGQE